MSWPNYSTGYRGKRTGQRAQGKTPAYALRQTHMRPENKAAQPTISTLTMVQYSESMPRNP